MLIMESRLRALVRAVLQEGEEDDLEISDAEVQRALKGDDLELSDAEVQGALTGDDLEISDAQLAAMERAYEKSRNVQVRSKNLKSGSQHLLGLKVQQPQAFEKLVRGWAGLSRNQKGGMVQWLRALESEEVRTQLSYSKVDNYGELSGHLLKNRNWLGFVGWYLALLQGSRQVVSRPLKYKGRTVELDPIKIGRRERSVELDPIKIGKKKG